MKQSQQDLILSSSSKRIIVLACPGSGKTSTLTKKIIKLNKSGISLKKIAAFTFTKKAAHEMFERIAKEIPVSKSEEKNICTLHSFGYRLLYLYKDIIGLKKEFTVALRSEKEAIAKEIVSDECDATDIIEEFLNYVSSIKNGFEINHYNFNLKQFNDYCSRMIENNLVDLDDFIYLPVKILQNNEVIKNRVSKMFDYIFVDEYQDINKIQNDFLDLLVTNNTNVFYVGDDDQSIYEFRGSNPNYILEKSKEGSNYDVFYLTTNYRSQKPIVEFSKKVLSELSTDNRREKVIISNKNNSTIKPVRNKPFISKSDEINYVINEIYKLITTSSVEPREIAVLCRYSSRKNRYGTRPHPELYEIEKGLHEKGIPASTYVLAENDNDMSKQIRNLCELLIAFSKDELDLNTLNWVKPNSFVKDKFAQILSLINNQYNMSLSINNPIENTINRIIEINPKLNQKSYQKRLDNLILTYSFVKKEFTFVHNGELPSKIITDIMLFKNEIQSGYDELNEIYKYAYLYCKSYEEAYETKDDSNKYDEIISSMNAFLCQEEKDKHMNGVKLLTAHQSKGLQFDVVFVVGLEAGGFPCNIEQLDARNLDNERRLFYVCITRAKELLYLSSTGYAIDNNIALANKSFIYNIPQQYFSTEVTSFKDIKFTINDNELSLANSENNKLIDDLESDCLIMAHLLNEKKKEIQLLEKKNSELNIDSMERKKNQEKIEELKSLIDSMSIESKQKEIDWNNKLKNLQDNANFYKSELDRIKSTSKASENLIKEATQNLDIITKELDRTKRINSELNIALSKEKNRVNELNLQLNSKTINKTIDDSKNEIIKYKNTYNNALKKIDCTQNESLDKIKDYVDDRLYQIIRHEYDIFMIQKKYPLLGERFSAGILLYKELINKITYFLNKKDSTLFRSSIQSYNYKGNLGILVQKILKHATSYSDKREFKISCFIDCYLGNRKFLNKKVYQEYEKLVNNLKQKNIKISTELLQDMRILYAVTTTCNHDENDVEKLFAKNYQDIVNELINNPSKKYYKIFGSFFEFIGLFIDDDSIMLPIR